MDITECTPSFETRVLEQEYTFINLIDRAGRLIEFWFDFLRAALRTMHDGS